MRYNRFEENIMKRNRKGFTMVEIIVVLLIIGILLAIMIPSIMGYVSKAKDAQLLTEARSVLLATKEMGAKLYHSDDLERLPNDDLIHKQIITNSGTQADLLEIELNKQKNGSGDFTIELNQKFIYYYDEEQRFEIKTNAEPITLAKRLNRNLSNIAQVKFMKDGSKLISIYDYLFERTSTSNIDSEGKNFGIKIKAKLSEDFGFSDNDYSFSIYRQSKNFSGAKDNVSIMVTEHQLTKEDINQTVKVTLFDYSDQQFQSVPVIRSGVVTVKTKNVDGSFPYLDVSSFKPDEN